MARLSVWLLGPFKAELDGDPLSGFRSNKVRALLAYLSIESHRPWARTTLAGLLWPDISEKAALSNLRNALSNLRHVLNDTRPDSPFLNISPSTIQFNPSATFWLDVQDFLDLGPKNDPPTPAEIAKLEKAFAMYRGDFMEGFSVDSPLFEEWMLSIRERVHRKLLQTVRLLAIGNEKAGDMAAALDYTYRWVELEPWDEAAYRHRMQLLAASGQRSAALAQYEVLCSLLERDLGVAPDPETVQLHEQIRSGQTERLSRMAPPLSESGASAISDPGPLPQFITDSSNMEKEPNLFVARQKELGQLEDGWKKAMQGKGNVHFVTGEPGSGKTALLAEFSGRIMRDQKNALIFWGQCNAYTGQGDPYFPFMNIIRLFAGEVESLLSGGGITLEHTQQLWKFLPETLAALLDYGPDLIPRFLSGGDRPSLVRSHPGINPEMLERLNEHIGGRLQGPDQTGLEQAALFEQFTQVLAVLSRSHPLIIVLDDLQWIDPGSVNLLFHLGRRLAGSKIMLLGAYRPEEISMEREGGKHPLEGVVLELGGLYGDIQVDLMQSEGEAFVDALLDSEPNALNSEFRKMLYKRTSGHPLFTIELLRGMQLRGEIVRDEKGRWVEDLRLSWETLPARVEAAIARRIHQLPDDCQELLTAACVEGEQFTGEIVAHVLEKDAGKVQKLFSQEIGRQHRLVVAQGLKHAGMQRLSCYKFRHSLFQLYLYNHLDNVDKAHLHVKVGKALENVYNQDQEKLGEIAYTLARHFESGGMAEKAVQYYTLAGKNALYLSANQEALEHFYRGLHLLETLPISPERDRQELELQLSLGPPLTALKGWAPPELATAYARAQELCQNIRDDVQLIPALWLLATYWLGRSKHIEVDRLSERFDRLAKQAGDPLLLSLASLQVSSFYQGRFSQAREALENASASRDLNQQCLLAQQYGMSPAVVGLAYLADTLWMLGYPEQADHARLEALELAAKIKHPMTSCYALARSCWLSITEGNNETLQDQSRKLYQVTQKYGFKVFEFASMVFDTWAKMQNGMISRTKIEQMHRAVENYGATGTLLNRASFLVLFGRACGLTGDIKRGLQAVNESIELAENTGELWYQAEAFREKGRLLVQQNNDLDKAEDCFQTACQIARQQNARLLELRALVSLYQLWQQRGKEHGREALAQIYNMFTEGFDTPDLRAAKTLLYA